MRFTRRQVVDETGVSAMTIYRWERDGKIPPPMRLERTKATIYDEAAVARIKEYRDRIVS